MAFVKIEEGGNDRFYILPWERCRDLLVDHHKAFLAKHNGVRPKKWSSLHCALAESALLPYQDKWDVIKENLK